jgi:hypothetical protein
MAAMNKILKRAPKLEKIKIRDARSLEFFTGAPCQKLTDVEIFGGSVPEKFKLPESVVKLTIQKAEFELPAAVDFFTSGTLSQLKILKLGEVRINNDYYSEEEEEENTPSPWSKIFTRLNLPKITSIAFEYCQGLSLDDAFLIFNAQATIPNLKEFSLHCYNRSTNNELFLEHFSQFCASSLGRTLESFELEGGRFDDMVFEELVLVAASNMERLKKLGLSGNLDQMGLVLEAGYHGAWPFLEELTLDNIFVGVDKESLMNDFKSTYQAIWPNLEIGFLYKWQNLF